ncbi:MAG: hypothetical protein M3Z85_06140 [Acidobacteriota bacterium]|nr:hypothetical protein [Acidobacteriota bacterium]MDQ6913660.1 hypothetical protein [Verrucomicrobiota bacterium]
MLFRIVACVVALGASSAWAQEAFNNSFSTAPAAATERAPAESAWLDLRQTTNASPQVAPRWIESITLVPVQPADGSQAHTVFRIRVQHPRADLQSMLLRLFFDDKPQQRPSIIAWDESGTQILQSGALGAGIDLSTSETILLPMIGVSCIDIDVPGDGSTVRGVYLDWMTSRNVAHPLSSDRRSFVPEPFSAAAPMPTQTADKATFGAVTATLSPDTIRIGASVQQGAAFQFGIEAAPLVAMLNFEVASAQIDSPPQVFVNGENLGAASLTLPDLADPAYRGETKRLVGAMRFHYTGWLRAQKIIPAANLRVGTNDVIVIGGSGTAASAVRATQIQLKYLWDKSDYVLDPN